METENQGEGWSKKFLENLLYSNSKRLVIKTNDKGKNPFIWSQFQIAYIDGVEQKYACCKFCKTFIKYTGRTGTGGLMRHLCFRTRNADVSSKIQKPKPGSSKENEEIKLPTKTWVRHRLERLVRRNSPRIGYVHNAKGKSDIWLHFRILMVDNVLTRYACCMLCRRIVTYTGRTGTGSMMRHKCNKDVKKLKVTDGEEIGNVVPNDVMIKSEESFEWDAKEPSIHVDENDMIWTPPEMYAYETPVDEKDGEIPTEVQQVFQQKHAALLNKTLRLFDVFENEEFLELAQFLINLGAQYGPMDVRNVFKPKMNLVTLNEA